MKKIVVVRVAPIGILKFNREVSLGESILLVSSFEENERLELCLRSARLER